MDLFLPIHLGSEELTCTARDSRYTQGFWEDVQAFVHAIVRGPRHEIRISSESLGISGLEGGYLDIWAFPPGVPLLQFADFVLLTRIGREAFGHPPDLGQPEATGACEDIAVVYQWTGLQQLEMPEVTPLQSPKCSFGLYEYLVQSLRTNDKITALPRGFKYLRRYRTTPNKPPKAILRYHGTLWVGTSEQRGAYGEMKS